jgi:hypothetical protein
MRYHDPPAGDVRVERALLPAAGDGVAGPADGRAALPGGQGRLVEYLAHQPHLPVREHAAAVGDGMPADSWPRCWRAKSP